MSKKKKAKKTTNVDNEVLADVSGRALLSEKEGDFCFSCKENEMFLSENELVYECRNCGHWEYSSS